MKRLTSFLFACLLFYVALNFSACNPYSRVSKTEYEKAFSMETLSNVSISIIGPHWEKYHAKECFYHVDGSFVYARYQDDLLYYGEFLDKRNAEEIYYVYGSEDFEAFAQEDGVWKESFTTKEENSFMRNAEFVKLYQKDFHLLEYNWKAQCYEYNFVEQGYEMRFRYFFKNAKLAKFEIANQEHEYNLVWQFYDYGKTKIPEWAEQN